jgi:hypothetical protein
VRLKPRADGTPRLASPNVSHKRELNTRAPIEHSRVTALLVVSDPITSEVGIQTK